MTPENFRSTLLTEELARKINQSIGSKLPDHTLIRDLTNYGNRDKYYFYPDELEASAHYSPSDSELIAEWLLLLKTKFKGEVSILKTSLTCVYQAGVHTLGQLRSLEAEQLNDIPKCLPHRGPFLVSAFSAPEQPEETGY